MVQINEEEYKSTLNNLLIGVVVHIYNISILFSNPEATNDFSDFLIIICSAPLFIVESFLVMN